MASLWLAGPGLGEKKGGVVQMEFYPAGRSVPQEKRTSRLFLRPLRETDVESDYEAVTSSAERLRRWSQGGWPAGDFTMAQNLADLQRHEREHIERKAFTFTVLDPEGTRCLGCVYIQPLWPEDVPLCKDAAYAADVGFWVRTSEVSSSLDEHLLATLCNWFQAEWAFDRIVFTVSPQDPHHAALFGAAGLERRLAYTSPDGRSWWVFG
jgi:RimJ/RimL family protein N-acetyltransferase